MSRKRNKESRNKGQKDYFEEKKQDNMPQSIEDKTETKEKFSIKRLYHKLPFKKISYFSFSFWGLTVVSFLALIFLVIALIQGSLSPKNEVKNVSDFNSAKSEFESRTGIEKSWFEEGISLPDTLLFVNMDKDAPQLIFKANRQKTVIAFTKSSLGKSVKHVETSDSLTFCNFIAQNFSIKEKDNVNTIAKEIGARTDYITDIEKSNNYYDIIFSLIYNTIVGDNEGHIAVTIENKKLKIIRANDFVWDRIDTDLFVNSMNKVVSNDSLSNKDKFIIANCKKLSNAKQTDIFDSTENRFKQFFGNDEVVQISRKLPVNFLYFNYRKEVLFIGSNQFAVSEANAKQYLPRLKSSAEAISYLVENDTTLYDFENSNIASDSILWGKVDNSKLANGKFKTNDFASDYTIIKTWNKSFLLYLSVIILLLYIVYVIFYWFAKGKKNKNTATYIGENEKREEIKSQITEMEFDLSSLTEEEKAVFEKIKPQLDAANSKIEQQNTELFNQKVDETIILRTQISDKEHEINTLNSLNQTLTDQNKELSIKITNALDDFKRLSDKKGSDLIESILMTYDKLLKGNSRSEYEKILNEEKEEYLSDFKKKEKFNTIKNNSDFLSKLANTKKESELLSKLDDLRKSVSTLPEIESLRKIYADLSKDEKDKERKKDDIISDILTRIDEYASGKELKPQFDIHKKNTETLRSISDIYNSTQKQLSDFYNLCQKLKEKENPDFWDRTALSVWAISQLAIPLLKIWKKEVWFADKADNISETLKSDLLQIYTTRYFLRDTNETKTLEDFKNALDKEIPYKLAEYNTYISQDSKAKLNVIDDNLRSQLTTALEKIKKFDRTQEFNDKMWNNFVKEFLEKAPYTEDKVWFFEQLFNISYHTADYLDYVKHNDNIVNYFNYQYLLNDFDVSKSYSFQVNHIEKSTPYSNRIFKWADDLGIRELKVLIEKYLVKP